MISERTFSESQLRKAFVTWQTEVRASPSVIFSSADHALKTAIERGLSDGDKLIEILTRKPA
jgi:hypothetical protein